MDRLVILVKVIPNAKTEKIEEMPKDSSGNHSFKVRITQTAERGKANQALIKLLATYFSVSQKQIKIISGLKSRNKIIALEV